MSMLDAILEPIFSSEWRVIIVVSVMLLVSAELGFRFGLRVYRTHDAAHKELLGGVQVSVLTLLGLLLAFAFAMAVNRFDLRRQVVLDEANAIGTLKFRVMLLPENHQVEVANLLRDYVAARLAFYDASADNTGQMAAEQHTARIQQELWSHAEAAAKESPTPVTVTFINALNDAFNFDAAGFTTFRQHVPSAVWVLLLSVAVCGCFESGYGAGAAGVRCFFTNTMLPLLIAVVILIVADIDRPRGGMIVVSRQPLLDLQQSMQSGLEKTSLENSQNRNIQ